MVRKRRCPVDADELERQRDEAEYRKGYAEAGRYLSDRAIYGEEFAEALELERELREED